MLYTDFYFCTFSFCCCSQLLDELKNGSDEVPRKLQFEGSADSSKARTITEAEFRWELNGKRTQLLQQHIHDNITEKDSHL